MSEVKDIAPAPWRLGFYDGDGLEAWTRRAQPGSRTTYFRGHLAETREREEVPQHDLRRINEVADCARELERRGLVDLVQERVSEGSCQYLAIRTSKTFRVVRSYAEAA